MYVLYPVRMEGVVVVVVVGSVRRYPNCQLLYVNIGRWSVVAKQRIATTTVLRTYEIPSMARLLARKIVL